MTITQLRYVLAVAEHQNFTRAAEKVFVTQPTLSMQIQKLEEELSVQIFDRVKKPVTLTEVGKKIVEQARNIVNESERIRDIVDQEKGFIGGNFRIGIIPTVMPTLLPMFLKTFITRYPKVELKIEELGTEALIEGILEGYLDAGIAATPLEEGGLNEKILYYEPFEAYIPAAHRLAQVEKLDVNDLEIDDILLLKDGHCFKDNVVNLCRVVKNVENDRFKLQSGSFETMLRLCDEGLGMTLLPYLHRLNLSDREIARLKPFKDPVPARQVSLVYAKSELKIQIIEALQEVILGVVKGAIAFQDVKIISPLKRKA